jgi:hypothetical protein
VTDTGILDVRAPDPAWRLERRYLTVGEERLPLRLVRFATGWIASLDTVTGPTIGLDRSPYLAAHRALEPLGLDLVASMTLVGRIRD